MRWQYWTAVAVIFGAVVYFMPGKKDETVVTNCTSVHIMNPPNQKLVTDDDKARHLFLSFKEMNSRLKEDTRRMSRAELINWAIKCKNLSLIKIELDDFVFDYNIEAIP